MKKNNLLYVILLVLIIFSGCIRNVKKEKSSKEQLSNVIFTINNKKMSGEFITKWKDKKVKLSFKWVGKDKILFVYHPITGKSYKIDLKNENKKIQIPEEYYTKLNEFLPIDINNFKESRYQSLDYYSYIKDGKEVLRIDFYKNKIDEITLFNDEKIYEINAIYSHNYVVKLVCKNIFSLKILEIN